MPEQRRKKKIPVKQTLFVLAVVLVLGLIFLIVGTGKIYHGSKKNSQEIEEGVRILKEIEAKTPGTGTSSGTEGGQGTGTSGQGEPTTQAPAEPSKPIDLSAEQEKILAVTEEDYYAKNIAGALQGTVILGDSLTMAAAEYGYIGYDVVVAKIGAGPLTAGDLFEEAIAHHPTVLYVVLGSNDIDNYGGDPNLFIDQYRSIVEMFKEALPGTKIFMHAIMPQQEGVGGEPGFEYRDLYNKALEEYCSQTDGVEYISADFILEAQPELYDVDGIHPVGAFYPKWLTFLADMAGLTK